MWEMMEMGHYLLTRWVWGADWGSFWIAIYFYSKFSKIDTIYELIWSGKK
jgi:hypothetical protein